jgi:hypothetical protein
VACIHVRCTFVTSRILRRLLVGWTTYCIIYCSPEVDMIQYREVTKRDVRWRVNAATNELAWELRLPLRQRIRWQARTYCLQDCQRNDIKISNFVLGLFQTEMWKLQNAISLRVFDIEATQLFSKLRVWFPLYDGLLPLANRSLLPALLLGCRWFPNFLQCAGRHYIPQRSAQKQNHPVSLIVLLKGFFCVVFIKTTACNFYAFYIQH